MGLHNRKRPEKAIGKLMLVLLLFTFCKCTFSQPDSTEIIKNVKKHYHKISLADGSPTYSVEQIKIDEVKKLNKDTFSVKVTVIGTFENHSIPDQEQREHDFEDKHTFLFFKNSYKQWDCVIKYD